MAECSFFGSVCYIVRTIERMLFGDAIEFMFVTITTDAAAAPYNFAASVIK